MVGSEMERPAWEEARKKEPQVTILVVEDEQSVLELLKVGFSYAGYRIETVERGWDALTFLQTREVDLVVLDIVLPDIDGFEVCRRIRERGLDVPILMLTGMREVGDRVKGLNMGADDYLTKPFSFDELLARVRALLRRSGRKKEPVVLTAGDLILDVETRLVKKGGKVIRLTPTEFSLLELFMRHPRRVFTRETLLTRVWGQDYVGDTNVVDVHVSHLRTKLGDRPPRLIVTIYGVGYAFHPE